MHQYAILIDGGFAKRKIGSAHKPATAMEFQQLIERIQEQPVLQNMQLHRVYYYDSVPLQSAHEKPLGGGKIEFANEAVATRSKQLFEQMCRLPYVALRLGELSFNGWGLKPRHLERAPGAAVEIRAEHLKPVITQKGVDMRIGMDIAALTLKKQVQVIVLVTGDSDFIPAIKFARREGARLFLVPLKQIVRPALYEHSDLILDFPLDGIAPPQVAKAKAVNPKAPPTAAPQTHS